MDESFIVYRKMYVPPLTPDNIDQVNPGDWAEHLQEFQRKGWQATIEAFLRAQTRLLGSCAILAWDGDGVIGKMYYTTREMWDAFRAVDAWMCVEHASMPQFVETLSDAETARLLASPSRALYVPCMNVGHFDTRYHRQGIATAMIEALKAWAGERGWRRIELMSCPDVVPYWALGPQHLRRGPLERRGFAVFSERTLSAEQAEFRRAAIRRILTGQVKATDWDARAYSHNLALVERLAETCDWEALCAREYLMAYDLQS
jgi:hypothetical protein